MNVSTRACAITLIASAALGAQSGVTPTSRVELGVSAVAARGSDVGYGQGFDVSLRWQPQRHRWLAIVGSVNAMSFGRVELSTDSQNIFADSPSSFEDFGIRSSIHSALIGPELSSQFGRVRTSVRLLGGVSDVTTGGELLRIRAPAYDEYRDYSLDEAPYPIDSRQASVATALLGGALSVPISRRLTVTTGLQRSLTSTATWMETAAFVFNRIVTDGFVVTPPSYTYKRRLDTWSWHVGLSYSP
jgi:hypothetical protein